MVPTDRLGPGAIAAILRGGADMARTGDALILTKPLSTGIATTAIKRGLREKRVRCAFH